MGRLDGKVALIIGGGADGPPNAGETLSIGNGRATAIMCAREGAAVMVADRALKLAEETAAAIREERGRAQAVEADVSREGIAGARLRPPSRHSARCTCSSTTSASASARIS